MSNRALVREMGFRSNEAPPEPVWEGELDRLCGSCGQEGPVMAAAWTRTGPVELECEDCGHQWSEEHDSEAI